jgi:hypothetical protein
VFGGSAAAGVQLSMLTIQPSIGDVITRSTARGSIKPLPRHRICAVDLDSHS